MSKVENDRASSLIRHQAQCSICRSPYREEFEESFVNWSGPTDWRNFFDFGRDSVYRHAHRCGLFERRRENLSMALEKIVERMDWTVLTGSNGIAAIKLLLELEEKKRKKGEADPTNSRAFAKFKAAKAEDSSVQEGARSDVVAAQETTGSENIPEAVDSDADTQLKDLVPVAKVSDAAEAPETKNFPADNQQFSEVPVVEPEAEPIEA